MPRKQPIDLAALLIEAAMTQPITEISQLLATATRIVQVRARIAPAATPKAPPRAVRPATGNPPPPPAGTQTGFGPTPVTTPVETKLTKPPKPPKPPVKSPTDNDRADLAAARERANQQTGVVGGGRGSGPRKPQRPATSAAPAAEPIPAIDPSAPVDLTATED